MKTIQISRINILWLTIFSIAMGYLECSVVVYLRAIYYPDGFAFPLSPIGNLHAVTEIGREAATLFMLIGIGVLTGKNKWEKFAVFLYTFAVWDIFYYLFLKILLGWPESLFTWDILFLIPTTWTGPVLSPVISAITMVFLSLVIFYRKTIEINISAKELWILIAGAFVQLIAFVWDYCAFLTENGILKYFYSYELTKDIAFNYIPDKFPWFIFLIGESIILYAIWLIYKKCFRNTKQV